MKAIKILLVVVAVSLSSLSYGISQDTLRINTHVLDSVLSMPHVVGDVIDVPILVYNPMDTTFSDSISFNYTIVAGGTTTTYNTASSIDTSGITATYTNPVTVPPHDSILLYSLHIVFATPDFVNGSSTVVIWPILMNTDPLVTDSSATDTVIVSNRTGITGPDAEKIKVYTSRQELIIQNTSKNSFGDIRIYDITGALLTEQKISQYAEIPMSPYAAGVYIVELTLPDGSRGIYKVLNAPSR